MTRELPAAYSAWIAAFVAARGPHLRGYCHGASEDMAAAFPELRVARGWVTDRANAHFFETEAGDFESGHWWCVAPDGSICDPTALQFGEARDLVYIEYDPARHGPLPTGKCPNCGWLIFPDDNAGGAHRECKADFEAYLERESRALTERRRGAGEL